MKTLDEKLQQLQNKVLNTDEKIRIMIIGLGSVGSYLLDYLISKADSRIEIIVVGRNYEKMISDVNIIKTAATIRKQLKAKISIEYNCNLDDIDSITSILKKWQPDFIVNSSRAYSGFKYGTISWPKLRAYGIWAPLSIKYAINIIMAYQKANCDAITINTSYSDVIIPWLKSAGLDYYDFGSGNLNHLIPRMKFYIQNKFNIDNLNDIDISIASSHFHDVVISKEGHAEGSEVLIDIKLHDKKLEIDQDELLKACKIPMPSDQKRNMMNASSNYDIINSILIAIINHSIQKIHTPGFNGEIGGYPVIINCQKEAKAYIDTSAFLLEQMRKANSNSIYLDGIEKVENGNLFYTDELIQKVKDKFDRKLVKKVNIYDLNQVSTFLIKEIIEPNTK